MLPLECVFKCVCFSVTAEKVFVCFTVLVCCINIFSILSWIVLCLFLTTGAGETGISQAENKCQRDHENCRKTLYTRVRVHEIKCRHPAIQAAKILWAKPYVNMTFFSVNVFLIFLDTVFVLKEPLCSGSETVKCSHCCSISKKRIFCT